MSEDYDTFFYEDDQNSQIYEAVMDTNLPPIPPRNPRLPPIPTRKQPPVPVPAQAPEMNYEDLNVVDCAPESNYEDLSVVDRVPTIPKLLWRLPPPVPNSSQRAPLPTLDTGAPELNYEDLNCFVGAPEENYEDLNNAAPEENYEDLNNATFTPQPPPVPETPRARLPVPDKSQRKPGRLPNMEEDSKKKTHDVNVKQVNENILISIRNNLKKTETRSPADSAKSRQEVPIKIQLTPTKVPMSIKPQVPKKPLNITLDKEKKSTINEKIATLSLDSTDTRKPLPQSVKVSPSNSFRLKNNPQQKPVKISQSSSFESKNSEDISDEEYESQEEYADAADLKSLEYQPYYYESLTKSVENKIFNGNTEDGTFVIRKSRTKSGHPYTMVVYYKTRTYRLKIRFEDDEYSIGEKKDDEKKFNSVIKMVEHFMVKPLLLIDAGSTKLKLPPIDI